MIKKKQIKALFTKNKFLEKRNMRNNSEYNKLVPKKQRKQQFPKERKKVET